MPQLPQPALPEPKHPEVDSMLSRKFGKEVANYFSGRNDLCLLYSQSITNTDMQAPR